MEADPSKRYGNLHHGAGDVFAHRWFAEVDWDKLRNREIQAPYIPRISGDGDASACVSIFCVRHRSTCSHLFAVSSGTQRSMRPSGMVHLRLIPMGINFPTLNILLHRGTEGQILCVPLFMYTSHVVAFGLCISGPPSITACNNKTGI